MIRSIAIIILAFIAIVSPAQKNKSVPATTGKPIVIGTSVELASTVLGETRTLNIYLPDGYDPKDTVKYPVVYLLDGGMDEDFIHIVGLFQFNSFEWIDRVKSSIVVGITNSDRKRDMTFPSAVASEQKNFPTAGHCDNFISFLEKELQPYIEKNYKVNSSKALIGESLGGLLATEILRTKPQLFNRYIIVSPSLWWNAGSILDADFSKLDSLSASTEIYLGVGKEGLTPTEPARVMEVDVNLLAEKLEAKKNEKVKIFFDYLPDEDHATVMHQAVYNAIKWMSEAEN